MTTNAYDESIASTCAARAICVGHRTLCAQTCVAYTELEAQIKASGVPKRYLSIGAEPSSAQSAAELIRAENASVAGFITAWGRDIGDHIRQGRGLYLHGRTTGTGKTTVATALGGDYIRAGVSEALANKRPVRGQLVYYVHTPTFFRSVKRVYEDNREVAAEASEAVDNATRKMMAADLVIFDEIGGEKPTEALTERFLAIIDHRWAEQKSIICTSNMTLRELEMNFVARIASRIDGMTAQIEFKGRDKRRKGVSA